MSLSGQSKMASKNNAAEWALRDIMIRRMLQSLETQQSKSNDESTQQEEEQSDLNSNFKD